MAQQNKGLVDLAHTSQFGPNNPGQLGTGTILGTNISPMANAQLGNPKNGKKFFNSLFDSAHASMYGPFNVRGQKGTGIAPDVFGNIPREINI
jgi:hypothetical protein